MEIGGRRAVDLDVGCLPGHRRGARRVGVERDAEPSRLAEQIRHVRVLESR